MPRPTYNKQSILKKVSQSKRIEKDVLKLANARFQVAKNEMLKQFEDHDVTQELEAGPNVKESNFLHDIVGGLFAFLGFQRGTNPIEPIRKILKEKTQFKQGKKKVSNKIRYEYEIRTPTKEEIAEASPNPVWLGRLGRSWVFGIEEGIGGLGLFISKFGIRTKWLKKSLAKAFTESESGTGLEVEIKEGGRPISGARVRTKYLSEILRKFRAKFK